MTDAISRSDFYTVQLVPLTAFEDAGKLNLEPMRQQTERLVNAGVRVLIPCAGSSEFHTLNTDEIVDAIKMTCEVVGDRARVVVPVGLQLSQAVSLGRRAVDAGADAMLVMPLVNPYLSDIGARDYYTELMEQVDCPTLIYKKDVFPSNELLLELADHPNLMGVKYSLADVTEYHRVVQEDAGRLDWFCGHAERYAPFFMMAGAPGYTSGAGNICPRLTLAMHQALAQRDLATAFELLAVLRPIEEYRARAGNSYNVSFLKSAIRHLGLDFGEPRPPYRRLTTDEHADIEALLRPILDAEDSL